MNEFTDVITKIAVYLFDTYLSTLPALQTFSLVITGVLLFFVVLMMKRLKTLGMKRDKFIDKWGIADLSKVKMQRTWKELTMEVATGKSAKMKKAINDADKLFDEALKNAGIVGKNADERIAKTDEMRVANIKEIKEAHRVSERIKKEPTFSLSPQEAWNIVGMYEKALRDLGLLK